MSDSRFAEGALAETVGQQREAGEHADLEPVPRFERAIVGMIERYAADPESFGTDSSTAVFVLGPGVDFTSVGVVAEAIEVPFFERGIGERGHTIWLTNETASVGRGHQVLPTEEAVATASAIPELAGRPSVIVLRDTDAFVCHFFDEGLKTGNPSSRLVVDSAPTLTPDELLGLVSRIHSSSFRVPRRHARGQSPWLNAAKYWPIAQAEGLFQGHLVTGLASALKRIAAESEVPCDSGNCDIVLKVRAGDSGRNPLAAIELKVSRDFNSKGTVTQPSATALWIRDGAEQARNYAVDLKADIAALVCFDMRREKVDEPTYFSQVDADDLNQGLVRARHNVYPSPKKLRAARTAGLEPAEDD